MIMTVSSEEAPKAIGPYSQAIEANGMLFVSGQLPVDPTTGQMVADGIEAQTNRVLDNIEAILKESGIDWGQVVKVEIFLKNLKGDYAKVNEVYGKRVSAETPPARQAVEVADLPLGSPIEVSCIASLPHKS